MSDRCGVCNSELSCCVAGGVDGPEMDCEVCILRAQVERIEQRLRAEMLETPLGSAELSISDEAIARAEKAELENAGLIKGSKDLMKINSDLTRAVEAEKEGRTISVRNGNRIIAEENRKVDLLRHAVEAADELATCVRRTVNYQGFNWGGLDRKLQHYQRARVTARAALDGKEERDG